VLAILLYSCKDEDVVNPNDLESTQASHDHLTAENIFNEVDYIVKEGLQNNGQNKSCPSYNLINNNPSDIDTLVINFGNDNECIHYGKIRSGKIVVTYTGSYIDSGSVITSNFDNYYINYNLIQGEIILVNQGLNNVGNICFTVDINNASIVNYDGSSIDWQSNRMRQWVNGKNTYDLSDDKYKITGKASGNGLNGRDFAISIVDTLHADLSCFPSCIITSGTAKVMPISYDNRTINYGDYLCNCDINVIINGTSYPIVTGY
jgi:hypothetical protein